MSEVNKKDYVEYFMTTEKDFGQYALESDFKKYLKLIDDFFYV